MSDVTKHVRAMCQMLGDTMTEEQAGKVMDWLCDNASISDREALLYDDNVVMTPLYSLLSENNAEMGGYSRY